MSSKGRPDGQTFGLLRDAGLTYVPLVEPRDVAAYVAAGHERVQALPENDRGLGYVRQYALAFARNAGIEWYWMLDDDITGFYVAEGGKCRRAAAADVLQAAEQAIVTEDSAHGGLEYQQYAWRNQPGHVTYGSYCDVAVMIRSSVMCDYRPETGVKVDRDFTLQVIATGMDVIRTGWLAFAAPANGSNPGGLHDEYAAAGREERDSRQLAALWPGIAEYKPKRDGRPDAKIHWRRLKAA